MSDATVTMDDLLPKLVQLDAAIEQKMPNVQEYLKMINLDLRANESLVHMMSDEQIANLVSAMREAQVMAMAPKTARKRGAKNILDNGKSIADFL